MPWSTFAAVPNGVPVHPAGALPITVLVCWPFAPHADHAEYVYPVACDDVGVHAWSVLPGSKVSLCILKGSLPVTVLVC